MLVSTPDFVAPADDDPNAGGLATHSSPGGPIGEVVVRAKPQPASRSSANALAAAIASAPASAPMPIRPADLDAINALASPTQSLQASPPPQSGPIDPSIAARTTQVGAIANPPQLQPRCPHPRNVVRATEQLSLHWSRRPASKLRRCHGCEIAAAAGKYGFGATKAVAPNVLT
jgi:hypothetical protein